MEHNEKIALQKVALEQAKIILSKSGINKNDPGYTYCLYEMQFAIYTQIKKLKSHVSSKNS